MEVLAIIATAISICTWADVVWLWVKNDGYDPAIYVRLASVVTILTIALWFLSFK